MNGAALYLSQFEVEDMKALALHAPREVEAWLEGFDRNSPAFRSRIVIAEGLYLALCEALLELEPQRGQAAPAGAEPGRENALSGGRGRVEERLHMLFRVPIF